MSIEKLLLIILFVAISYYPICGIVGFIEFIQGRKRGTGMTIIIDDDGIAHKVITASEYQQMLDEILHLQTYVFWEGDELKVERDEVINIIQKHKGEQA